MNINKILLILIMMFIPYMVYAESCDVDSISINSVTVEEKTDNVTEISKPEINNNSINLDLSMSDVGDNIKYKIEINNNTKEDYELDKNSFNLNSEYMDYTLEFEDNSNIIKSNSSKIVYLSVEYKNEVSEDSYNNGSYTENKTSSVDMYSYNIIDKIINPKTGDSHYVLIIGLVLTGSIILFLIIKKKKNIELVIILALTLTIIPLTTRALNKCGISIESKIQILNITEFDTGEIVNAKMELLANGKDNIYTFKRSTTLPDNIKTLVEEQKNIDINTISNEEYITRRKNILSSNFSCSNASFNSSSLTVIVLKSNFFCSSTNVLILSGNVELLLNV